MPNKILVLKNRKNNKNIENEYGSDTWHKKNLTLYIYYWFFFFEESKMKYITTWKRYSPYKVHQGINARSEQYLQRELQ